MRRGGGGNRRRGPPSDPMQCLGGTPHVSPSGYDWRGGVHRSGVAIPSGSDIRVPSRVLSAAKQGESGAPERVGSPAGAQEGVHRHAPVARLRESPRGYPKHMFGKRGRTRTVPQRGKAVSSEVTSGCPKRSEGGSPVGTRTNTAFRAEPCRTWNGTREHERGAASHTGDSASFVRAGSAEKFSLPRRTQPESAHARGRRQPDRG